MKEDDGRILICYSRKLLILMKVSGALPMNPRNTFLRLMSQLYIAITAICYAHTIFETLLYFFINAEKTQVLLRGLWIKGSLLIYVLQILGFLMKRKDVHEILHSCPEVIKENFGTVLKMYMRKARRLCYLIVWLYMLISAAVSIALENRNYFFNDPEEEKATIERAENKSEDFIAQYLSPTLASVFFALNGYVQIFVHTSLGLFQLSYAMIYFHICCFIQGYADHLVDSMSELVITTEKSSENRIWPSSINPEKVDVRYIATLHQYILKLIKMANEVYSFQLQMKMWRIILVLCLTAKEITDHAEISSQSAVLALEFATNMLELFIFGWLAENLIDAEVKFRTEVLSKLATAPHINSADYTSLEIIALGSNIKYSLKAGPFYKLSLKTLNAITAASYSYYSFLRNVKIDKIKSEGS